MARFQGRQISVLIGVVGHDYDQAKHFATQLRGGRPSHSPLAIASNSPGTMPLAIQTSAIDLESSDPELAEIDYLVVLVDDRPGQRSVLKKSLETLRDELEKHRKDLNSLPGTVAYLSSEKSVQGAELCRGLGLGHFQFTREVSAAFVEHVVIRSQRLFLGLGNQVILGQAFAFIPQTAYGAPMVKELLDSLGLELPKQNVVKPVLGENGGFIPGAKVIARSFEELELVSLTSDKMLYTAGRDRAHILVLKPTAPAGTGQLVIERNGQPFQKRPFQFSDQGMFVATLLDLTVGAYSVTLEGHSSQTLEFQVAEYSLAPLTAKFAHQNLEESQLNFRIELETFGIPVEGSVRADLREAGRVLHSVTVDAQDGVIEGSLQLSGVGPHDVQLTVEADPSKIAVLPLRGSRQSERELTLMSALGYERHASLIPGEATEEARGLHVREGGMRNTPVRLVELHDDELALKIMAKNIDVLSVVVWDMAKNSYHSENLTQPKPGDHFNFQFDGPLALILIGAFIDGKPWEGWTTFIRSSDLKVAIQAPSSAKPGETVTLDIEAGSKDKPASVFLVVKDDRLLTQDTPSTRLAASLKAAVDEHTPSLAIGEPKGSVADFSKGESKSLNSALPKLQEIASKVRPNYPGGFRSGRPGLTRGDPFAFRGEANRSRGLSGSFGNDPFAAPAGGDPFAAPAGGDPFGLSGSPPPLDPFSSGQPFGSVGGPPDPFSSPPTFSAPPPPMASPFASAGGDDPFASAGGDDPFGSAGGEDPFASADAGDPFGGPPSFSRAFGADVEGSAVIDDLFDDLSEGTTFEEEDVAEEAVLSLSADSPRIVDDLESSAAIPIPKLAKSELKEQKKKSGGGQDKSPPPAPKVNKEKAPPEVIFAECIEVAGKASQELTLGPGLSRYIVEAFALRGFDWSAAETRFQSMQDPYVEVTLPPFIGEMDAHLGVVHVGCKVGDFYLKITKDGQEVKSVLGDRPVIADIALPRGQHEIHFLASPGLFEFQVTCISTGETASVTRRINEPGKLIEQVQQLTLLKAGESFSKTDEILDFKVLPGIDKPFKQLMTATSNYAHKCCEQTAAKMLSSVAAYLFAGDDAKQRQDAENSIVAGMTRLESMWLRGRGFTMYPESSGVDTYWGPKATVHLFEFETLEGLKDCSPALQSAIAKGLEMATDTATPYKISRHPTDANSPRDCYRILRSQHSAERVKEHAFEKLQSFFTLNEKSIVLTDQSRGKVEQRAELCYVAAALLTSGRASAAQLGSCIDVTNQIMESLGSAGRLYSTVDSVALVALMSELDKAGLLSASGTDLVINGAAMKSTDMEGFKGEIQSIEVSAGILPLEVTKETTQSWESFESNLEFSLSLEKNGQPTRTLKIGDSVVLRCKLSNGYKAGDILHVCLPPCLSRIYGGGLVKRFSVDFAGRDEVQVDLVATALTVHRKGKKLASQSYAAIVRNMFEEERIGNPGPLDIKVGPQVEGQDARVLDGFTKFF